MLHLSDYTVPEELEGADATLMIEALMADGLDLNPAEQTFLRRVIQRVQPEQMQQPSKLRIVLHFSCKHLHLQAAVLTLQPWQWPCSNKFPI